MTKRKRIPYGTNYSMAEEFNEMTRFTEKKVRDMLDYYTTTCEFHHTTDELIELMKPWYDNYSFAKGIYGLGKTKLHKIVVVYHGMDMAVCEEV